MIKMRPYAPPDRIAIRDSIDEEISDDIEDDVFIRDGKSAKMNEEKGLKRPLMAPRRKSNKNLNPAPIMKKHRRCWKCCEPFCYGLAALTILIALIFLAALILTLFPIPLQKIKVWLKREQPVRASLVTYGVIEPEQVPCTQISVQRIWSKTFPRLNNESPVRKADLNGDNVLDVIFGYGIDDNIQYEDFPLPKCTSARQDDEVTCEGGIIALNGVSGNMLWQSWSVANVFSLYCSVDIDQDGYPDCIAAGRRGMIYAVNGRNGNTIWNFREIDVETNSPIIIDLYTINTVRDLDGDQIQDIIAVHVEEREASRTGHIKAISGKTGKTLRSIPTPLREEVFVPLQVVVQEDGTELLLVITGGQNTPGGVYSIRLLSIMQYTSEKEFTPLFQTEFSGIMVPAVLTDITGDQIEDIIVSSFNSTVYAFDGRNYSALWNYSFPASESVSSIVPGHFDHDNVTDFMVKYNTGPGFPVYYYSQTTILSGLTGQPLLNTMMTDSGGPNSLLGGASISQTFGGDFFLHWQVQCRGKTDSKDAYEFIPDSDIILQARADTCLLRYNTSTVLKLYAIARHVEPPGAVIFSSDDLSVQLNRTENRQITQPNSISPLKHPKMTKKLMAKEYLASDGQPISLLNRKGASKIREEMIEPSFRKPILDNKIPVLQLDNKIPVLQESDTDRQVYDQVKPYFPYLPLNKQAGRDFKDYETDQRNPEDYDIYNEEQNERPIHLRTKYPGNRGVRSEYLDYESVVKTESNSSNSVTNNSNKNDQRQRLNLWDLEMEKEETEAAKEAHKYDFTARQRREDTPKEDSDFFLASVASAGVLLPSLEKSTSSIDFAFVLNIRESENYPPLFLPQDLNCVEDRLSAFKGYTNDRIRKFEKQFIEECLKARISGYAPNVPKYESQIVITRISITCTCGNLQQTEVCSKLNEFDKQEWTEYMGNTGNGLYKSN